MKLPQKKTWLKCGVMLLVLFSILIARSVYSHKMRQQTRQQVELSGGRVDYGTPPTIIPMIYQLPESFATELYDLTLNQWDHDSGNIAHLGNYASLYDLTLNRPDEVSTETLQFLANVSALRTLRVPAEKPLEECFRQFQNSKVPNILINNDLILKLINSNAHHPDMSREEIFQQLETIIEQESDHLSVAEVEELALIKNLNILQLNDVFMKPETARRLGQADIPKLNYLFQAFADPQKNLTQTTQFVRVYGPVEVLTLNTLSRDLQLSSALTDEINPLPGEKHLTLVLSHTSNIETQLSEAIDTSKLRHLTLFPFYFNRDSEIPVDLKQWPAEKLQNIRSFKLLDYTEMSTAFDLNDLKLFPLLEHFEYDCKMNSVNWTAIKSLPNLKSLSLPSFYKKKDFAQDFQLPEKLEILECESGMIPYDILERLLQRPYLKRIACDHDGGAHYSESEKKIRRICSEHGWTLKHIDYLGYNLERNPDKPGK